MRTAEKLCMKVRSLHLLVATIFLEHYMMISLNYTIFLVPLMSELES